ncbi:hypothetical protein TELCIR_02857 [Teladorsagia circumcincta]|uniref:Uncharacterized protein n=1 Tax=Teladorsagia circumcincta TaxID=45464 RepID=A0A2G9UY08_TELCI|nr:hypothetical protein TELCIR_02857 [Teladorsagia circumcincta]
MITVTSKDSDSFPKTASALLLRSEGMVLLSARTAVANLSKIVIQSVLEAIFAEFSHTFRFKDLAPGPTTQEDEGRLLVEQDQLENDVFSCGIESNMLSDLTLQVDEVLLCIFIPEQPQKNGEILSQNCTMGFYTNTIGDCLRMCVEEYPWCIGVSVPPYYWTWQVACMNQELRYQGVILTDRKLLHDSAKLNVAKISLKERMGHGGSAARASQGRTDVFRLPLTPASTAHLAKSKLEDGDDENGGKNFEVQLF